MTYFVCVLALAAAFMSGVLLAVGIEELIDNFRDMYSTLTNFTLGILLIVGASSPVWWNYFGSLSDQYKLIYIGLAISCWLLYPSIKIVNLYKTYAREETDCANL